MTKHEETEEQKFWSQVQKGPECWVWTGYKNDRGYGGISIRISGQKKYRRAHRVSYELAKGPIPAGMLICHTCDNPSCVNPAHLFAGTSLDNVHDMYLKNRDTNRFLATESHEAPHPDYITGQFRCWGWNCQFCGGSESGITGLERTHKSYHKHRKSCQSTPRNIRYYGLPVEVPTAVVEEFWRNVGTRDDASCWVWQGRKKRHPAIKHGCAWISARRVIWIIKNGELATSVKLKTVCGDSLCVNPSHLAIMGASQIPPETGS